MGRDVAGMGAQMTERRLTDDFAMRSPLAERQPHRVPMAEVVAEVTREVHRRREAYPIMVQRGSLDQAEARRHQAILAAIQADLARVFEPAGTLPLASDDDPAPIGWGAKVRELRRELAIRRAAYPKWVASATNPLTEADARIRLEAFDAAHYLYWHQLFAFGGPVKFAERIDAALAGDRAALARIYFLAERGADRARGPAWRDHGDEADGAVDPGAAWAAAAELAKGVAHGTHPLEVFAAAPLARIARALRQQREGFLARNVPPLLAAQVEADALLYDVECWLGLLAIRHGAITKDDFVGTSAPLAAAA